MLVTSLPIFFMSSIEKESLLLSSALRGQNPASTLSSHRFKGEGGVASGGEERESGNSSRDRFRKVTVVLQKSALQNNMKPLS